MPDMEILHKTYYIIRLILQALSSTPNTKTHNEGVFLCSVCLGGVACVGRRIKDTEHKITPEGVVVCSACVVQHRKYAEHKITPTKVWFRPRRVWEAFVEKEEILLVTITVNEINKT